MMVNYHYDGKFVTKSHQKFTIAFILNYNFKYVKDDVLAFSHVTF